MELQSNLKEPKIKPIMDKVTGAEPRVKIILEENDNIPPNGQYFGVNGKGFIIRPGEVVNVPLGLLSVLDSAVESRPVISPLTRQTTGYRDRLRYPYRRVE